MILDIFIFKGCIPVLLSNGWVLPFSELIDWSKAVVWGDERRLTQIIPQLRELPEDRLIRMREFCILYYYEYFSSIEKIIKATLDILKQRISNV
jgi:glucuronyl/N-acetylglucosaminyl transferase EXT1